MRSARALLAAAPLLVGLGWGPAAAADMPALIAPYLAARDAARLGQVSGEASADPRRPTAPREPVEGVSVLLMPRSAEFDAELDQIKGQQRDSLRSAAETAGRIDSALEGYRGALLWGGGGELIRGEVSDGSGRFRLAGVPAGEWLLIAWRPERQDAHASRMRGRDAGRYQHLPRPVGSSVVSMWRLPVSVAAGETATVALNERNIWLTEVRVEYRSPEDSDRAPKGGSPRRR